jgi:hypothetical protein
MAAAERALPRSGRHIFAEVAALQDNAMSTFCWVGLLKGSRSAATPVEQDLSGRHA